MLKLRVLTALVLAPAIVFATLALPHSGFAFIAALIFCMGAWEWAGLSGLSTSARAGYVGLLAALFALTYSLLAVSADLGYLLMGIGILWWGVALVLIVRFPSGKAFWLTSSAARGMAGLLVLLPSWAGLVALHGLDRQLALLLMVLTSFADIGAYFAGRAFGRHKLAPEVSPGKTWEGLFGALAVTFLVAYVSTRVIAVRPELEGAFIVLCVVTVVVSVLGDLVESMFKRMVGAKDSGGLLPGHGGVLDRIDSITAAAPLFALGVVWLQVVP